LEDSRNALFLSNLPIKFFSMWTVLERRGRLVNLDTELRGLDATVAGLDSRALENALREGRYDTVVFLHVSPGSYFYTPVPVPNHERLPDLLASQTAHRQMRRHAFPQYGCTVTVWRRAASGATDAL